MMYFHCRFWAWKSENAWGESKPVVKDHITIDLSLAPAMTWRPLITSGSNQELTEIWCYCPFYQKLTVINWQYKKDAAVLSFLLSSIPSTEARVWALPTIVVAVLHHEASPWIWWMVWSFCFKVSNKHPLFWFCCLISVVLMAILLDSHSSSFSILESTFNWTLCKAFKQIMKKPSSKRLVSMNPFKLNS